MCRSGGDWGTVLFWADHWIIWLLLPGSSSCYLIWVTCYLISEQKAAKIKLNAQLEHLCVFVASMIKLIYLCIHFKLLSLTCSFVWLYKLCIDTFTRTHFSTCVAMQLFSDPFRHCYSTSCFHSCADLWLPGDRCVWNKHLPGGAAVAPRQWVSGGGPDQRVHASAHGLSRRNGGETRARMSAGRQSDRLKEIHTTGSWLRRTSEQYFIQV